MTPITSSASSPPISATILEQAPPSSSQEPPPEMVSPSVIALNHEPEAIPESTIQQQQQHQSYWDYSSVPNGTYPGASTAYRLSDPSGSLLLDSPYAEPYYHPNSNSFVITTASSSAGYEPYANAGAPTSTADYYTAAHHAVSGSSHLTPLSNQIPETSYILSGLDPTGVESVYSTYPGSQVLTAQCAGEDSQDSAPATYINLATTSNRNR